MLKLRLRLSLLFIPGIITIASLSDYPLRAEESCRNESSSSFTKSADRNTAKCLGSKDIRDEFASSFYRYGLNYQESQKIHNQALNLLGISFKGGLNLNFPEQRIVSDGHLLWLKFNEVLERDSLPKSIYNNDISNGYNTSIGNFD